MTGASRAHGARAASPSFMRAVPSCISRSVCRGKTCGRIDRKQQVRRRYADQILLCTCLRFCCPSGTSGERKKQLSLRAALQLILCAALLLVRCSCILAVLAVGAARQTRTLACSGTSSLDSRGTCSSLLEPRSACARPRLMICSTPCSPACTYARFLSLAAFF